MRLHLLLVSVLLLGGCKLDSFLYGVNRVDAYTFEVKGDDESTTITADRYESGHVLVDDGAVTIQTVYVKAAVQPPPKGYCLFFHGKGGTLSNQFERVKRFSNYGYDVMAMDYRGFGASSDVEITEDGIGRDTKAVLEAFRSLIPENPRLIFWGDSFGTAAAAQRAHEDNPSGLILEEPFANIELLGAQDSSAMDIPYDFVTKDSWDTNARVHDLKGVPKLIFRGSADTLIDPSNSQVIYDNAKDPKRIGLLEGGTHGNLHKIEGYKELVNGFLDEMVP